MSNAVLLGQYLSIIQAALFAAFEPNSIGGEKPRTVLSTPNITVSPQHIARTKGGNEASFTNTDTAVLFDFSLRFPMPPATGDPATVLAQFKCDVANQIYAALMVPQIWAGILNFPLVTDVTFPDPDPLYEGTIEVQGRFTGETSTNWF